MFAQRLESLVLRGELSTNTWKAQRFLHRQVAIWSRGIGVDMGPTHGVDMGPEDYSSSTKKCR